MDFTAAGLGILHKNTKYLKEPAKREDLPSAQDSVAPLREHSKGDRMKTKGVDTRKLLFL